MKNRVLILFILCSILYSGCYKDGDFEALNHRFEIDGELHPSLGLPVGSCSMDMAGLLKVWQPTISKANFDPQSQLFILSYDSVFSSEITFDAKHGTGHSGERKSGTTHTKEQILQDSIPIDLFDNIQNLDDIAFDQLYASLSTFTIANTANGSGINPEALDEHNIQVKFDNIKIILEGSNGSATFSTAATFTIMDLINGETLNFIDQQDISQYLNLRPTSIRYEFRISISYDDEGYDLWEMADFFKEILNIRSITTNVTLSADFPLKIKGSLKFNMEMNMDLGTVEEAMADIRNKIDFGDSSFLALRFLNTIPLSFTMTDTLIDENGTIIKDNEGNTVHLYDPNTVIAACTTKDTVIDGEHYNISDYKKGTDVVMKTPIDDANLDLIVRTRKMKIGININTGATTSSDNFISIRKDDRLKSSLFIVFNPSGEHFDVK